VRENKEVMMVSGIELSNGMRFEKANKDERDRCGSQLESRV
jgi:hypothetical protein